MKLIIAGCRDMNVSVEAMDQLVTLMNTEKLDTFVSEIVSGRAKGVDTSGEDYAKWAKLPVKLFPADWNTYGKAAGHIRNAKMADYADALLAIWDGESKGTGNMIKTAEKKGLIVGVIDGRIYRQ